MRVYVHQSTDLVMRVSNHRECGTNDQLGLLAAQLTLPYTLRWRSKKTHDPNQKRSSPKFCIYVFCLCLQRLVLAIQKAIRKSICA